MVKIDNWKLNSMELANNIFKSDSHGNSMSCLCSCGRFKSEGQGRIQNGKHLRIDEALTKLRQELSDMQEQDKGIFKQLMNVSANVERLRHEIRLEEESKRHLENGDESESDSDVSLIDEEDAQRIDIKSFNQARHVISVQASSIHNRQQLPQQTSKVTIDHQRCDSGIMVDESDELIPTSMNVAQRREMFEHNQGATRSTPSKQSPRSPAKCTITVVDSANVRRSHVRSKSAEGQIDVEPELVRLGKFQVRAPDEVNIEQRSNPSIDQLSNEEAVRYSLRKKTGNGASREGLLVDISENGELKLHNNIKTVQKNAEVRHSEVRNAVFATLNSVQTRKQTREHAGKLPPDADEPIKHAHHNGNQTQHNSKTHNAKYLAINNNNNNSTTHGSSIPHSRSSNGIVKLREVRASEKVPRSRSMDGILDSNGDDDFVDYDDGKADGEEMPFRRYSSCNYGNRNPAQLDPRASGRVGYGHLAHSNNMEDDAKAYFDALKSKKVMIRSISSASII